MFKKTFSKLSKIISFHLLRTTCFKSDGLNQHDHIFTPYLSVLIDFIIPVMMTKFFDQRTHYINSTWIPR